MDHTTMMAWMAWIGMGITKGKMGAALRGTMVLGGTGQSLVAVNAVPRTRSGAMVTEKAVQGAKADKRRNSRGAQAARVTGKAEQAAEVREGRTTTGATVTERAERAAKADRRRTALGGTATEKAEQAARVSRRKTATGVVEMGRAEHAAKASKRKTAIEVMEKGEVEDAEKASERTATGAMLVGKPPINVVRLSQRANPRKVKARPEAVAMMTQVAMRSCIQVNRSRAARPRSPRGAPAARAPFPRRTFRTRGSHRWRYPSN
mmetsp:Transcript_106847/g.312329  ORF Transcript_106847/g.312329 Transcript_106847/m.312329 type:complete len:263 (+) Transcript_106847:677-1465(+)